MKPLKIGKIRAGAWPDAFKRKNRENKLPKGAAYNENSGNCRKLEDVQNPG